MTKTVSASEWIQGGGDSREPVHQPVLCGNNPSGLPNIILFIPYITHHMAYKTSAQCIALQGQT